MFSRWVQENFFKDMRDAWNLDALPEHGFETLDDDTLVVNPHMRTVGKDIREEPGAPRSAACADRQGARQRTLSLPRSAPSRRTSPNSRSAARPWPAMPVSANVPAATGPTPCHELNTPPHRSRPHDLPSRRNPHDGPRDPGKGATQHRGSPASHHSDACDVAFDRRESLGTPNNELFGAHEPCPSVPLPTLRLPPRGNRRTARGETWFGYSFVPGDFHPQPSASLPCMTRRLLAHGWRMLALGRWAAIRFLQAIRKRLSPPAAETHDDPGAPP